MPANHGAVVTGSRNLDRLVEVKSTPYPPLEDNAIIVKAIAYAVNPSDWKHILLEHFVSQVSSDVTKLFGFGFRLLERPLGYFGSNIGWFIGKNLTFARRGVVLGCDVSGVVEAVGPKVTGFSKGDIVSTFIHGAMGKNGAFSKYVSTSPNATIKYAPSQLLQKPLSPGKYPSSAINSFEGAASVSLGLATVGLSLHCNLAIPVNKVENKDDYILIWGGATATGILAVQVAKLIYGIKVITTASQRNHSLLLSLGADHVFDYNDENVVQKIKDVGSGNIRYGYDCVATTETFQAVYDATEGPEETRLENLLFLTEKSIVPKPNRKVKYSTANVYLVDGNRHMGMKATPGMIELFLVYWKELLPPVLDHLKTAPLQVLSPGLLSANEGLRLLVENKVSGHKVVFRKDDVSD